MSIIKLSDPEYWAKFGRRAQTFQGEERDIDSDGVYQCKWYFDRFYNMFRLFEIADVKIQADKHSIRVTGRIGHYIFTMSNGGEYRSGVDYAFDKPFTLENIDCGGGDQRIIQKVLKSKS
jgi:hypothetical protein